MAQKRSRSSGSSKRKAPASAGSANDAIGLSTFAGAVSPSAAAALSANGARGVAARDATKAERAELRDIWVYAGMLLVVGGVVAALFSLAVGYLLVPLFAMLGLVCVLGAIVLSLSASERHAQARRNSDSVAAQRIFD
jgi:hypothetical protein